MEGRMHGYGWGDQDGQGGYGGQQRGDHEHGLSSYNPGQQPFDNGRRASRASPPSPQGGSDRGAGAPGGQDMSWADRNNPFKRVDALVTDPTQASAYKTMMALALLTFVMTIVGLVTVCAWFNFMGLLHIAPLVYPLLSWVMDLRYYAGLTAIVMLSAVVSMIAGLASGCALASFLVNSLYLALNGGILYYCMQLDADVKRNCDEMMTSCACRQASTAPDGGRK